MPKRLPHSLLYAYFGGFILLIAALAWFRPVTHQDNSQPIAFPHTVHAGQLGLACNFCHESVTQGPQAGMPTVDKCVSCHQAIATERPEIQKLLSYHEKGEPIRWRRIHQVPDFIYFTHKRHVRSGLDCSACHGAIEEMKEVRRVRSLQMGWCLSCHRSRGASFDCATCHK